MTKIIYQVDGHPVAVLSPCSKVLSALQVAEKDVPTGVPFWITDGSEIPSDRSQRDAWDLDLSALGEPSGVGK